jgi:hypothetical protein
VLRSRVRTVVGIARLLLVGVLRLVDNGILCLPAVAAATDCGGTTNDSSRSMSTECVVREADVALATTLVRAAGVDEDTFEVAAAGARRSLAARGRRDGFNSANGPKHEYIRCTQSPRPPTTTTTTSWHVRSTMHLSNGRLN